MNRHRIRQALLFATLLLASPAFPQEPAPEPGSLEANKAVVSHYLQILGGGSLDELDQVIGSDFLDRTPGAPKVQGPGSIRDSQKRARELFEEIRYKVGDLVAEGDRVAALYTVRATRKAEGGAGKPVEVIGITLFRIADGKIRETWIVNDQLELFSQLGFTIQAPGAPPSKLAPPVKAPAKPPVKPPRS
ncbi:MAG: ester cyclase [Thermoanaerobaculia bacterium]